MQDADRLAVAPYAPAKSEKGFLMRKRTILIGLFVGLVMGLGFSSVRARPDENGNGKLDAEFLEPVAWLAEQIGRRYVEPVDHGVLLVGACQGTLSKLDPHCTYQPPKAPAESEGEGELVGPGFEIRFDPIRKAPFIEESVRGTAAFQQALLPGDAILEAREESTGEVTERTDLEDLHGAVKMLRGKPGTAVTITVLQPDDQEKRDITLERKTGAPPGVSVVEMLDPQLKIGYVHLSCFSEAVAAELKAAMRELEEQAVEGLILDMRFNPGRPLGDARACGELFLHGKVLARIKRRTGPETVVRTPGEESQEGLPMVALVNRFTAGWAEVITAALHDHNRAIVVGERTFGSASIREPFPSGFDDGTILLTTARYYSPNGNVIEEKGVEPDVELELSRQDSRKLALYMSNGALESSKPTQTDQGQQTDSDGGGNTEEEADEEFRDVQLERALEVLTKELTEARTPATAVPETAAPAVSE